MIAELASAQLKLGCLPEIATSMALDPRPNQTFQGIEINRFPYIYPYTGLTQKDQYQMDQKGGNLFSWPLMKYLSVQEGVRVMHVHALKRLAASVRTVARMRKIPYVVTIHGGSFDVPPQETERMLEPTHGPFKLEWGKLLGAFLGSHRVLQDADWVFCVGENEYRKAIEHLGHDRISYLPNGVDDRKFRSGYSSQFREQYAIPKDEYVISCIGRIDFQKNQRLLIESFRHVLQLNHKSTLVMIGNVTQEDYAWELECLIARYGMNNKIRWIKGVRSDSEVLINAYHASDVVILPSIHEPFGIVVLEAWSAGKPVIVSNVGGLKSLVENGVTGLKINPQATNAPYQLTRQILKLQQDRNIARLLGECGRQQVALNYRWSTISSKIESVYSYVEDMNRSRISHSQSTAGQPA